MKEEAEIVKILLAALALSALILSVVFVAGYSTAISDIRDECQLFGSFELNNEVYKCDEALTK